MLPCSKKMDLSKQYKNTLEETQKHLIKAVEAMLTVLSFVTVDQEQEQYAQKIGTPKDSTPTGSLWLLFKLL
jgi:ribonucleotide reductase beta subunit family protein with ferritin-like domain